MRSPRAYAIMSLCLLGCSDDPSGGIEIKDGGGDAEAGAVPVVHVDGGTDAGQANAPLEVSILPLTVTELPSSGEQAVDGLILVSRGSSDVADAVVTLNGTAIPYMSSGAYDVGAANLAAIAPGTTITVVATTANPPASQTLTFVCPPAITFTNPAGGATLTQGTTVNVTWTPGIPHDGFRIAGGPILGFFACYTKATGTTVTRAGHGSWFLDLEVGQTSQALEVTDQCARHLLEIQYPGELTTVTNGTSYNMGQCSYRHRVMLLGN